MSKLYRRLEGRDKRQNAMPAPESPTIMIAVDQLAALQQRWPKLLARYGVGESAADRPLRQLIDAYSTPNRFYHTIEHLAEMFPLIDRLPQDLTQEVKYPSIVELAVWFHDVVYDSQASDNEEESAAWARELLTPLGLPSSVLDRLGQLIHATAHFTPAEAPDSDTAALLDADLAILGAAPERYLRYSNDIRREYLWVPEAEYRSGRIAVLRRFLARSRIYHHEITFNEREEQARRNLLGEIRLLSTPRTELPPSAL
jgi:predicted metal-dependent HD superfamily phosphohydrolase